MRKRNRMRKREKDEREIARGKQKDRGREPWCLSQSERKNCKVLFLIVYKWT